MKKRLLSSLKNIDMKLYLSLIIMGLVPTVYTTLRTFFLGQMPGDWSYSIAGQLSWVNLIYEVLDEAIILPLFFCLGSPEKDSENFSIKIKSGIILSAGIYVLLAVAIILFARPLLIFMAADQSILQESVSYIRIESVANVFGIVYRFLLVALITTGKSVYVYIITALKLIISIISDTFMISTLPFSMNLGVNGIGYSNIIINIILMIIIWSLLKKSGYLNDNTKLSLRWIKTFWKTGFISGTESFVRNLAYMMMVSRMVNMVGEQGTYWVANNFIWGWMLLPVLQLGELIKQETAKTRENVKDNTPGYFFITLIIVLIWIITLPLYKPFMKNILGFDDVEKLFELVMVLFIPYITYAFQNIFDATFYGCGKTNLMLFESIVTNSVFYGGLFIAYIAGVWTPTLLGIALMFGIGNIFDAFVSGGAYIYFRKHMENSK